MINTTRRISLKDQKSKLLIRIGVSTVLFCLCFTSIFSQDNTREGLPSNNERKRFEVLVFLGSECPISQDYIGTLNQLNGQYELTGNIVGVIPEKLSKKELEAFRTDYQATFTMEPDADLKLVKKYSITVTPEAVLLNTNGVVIYRGAIDNWYYELGRHRPAATEHYLINAIEDMLKGNNVAVKETTPVGCILSKHH